MVEKLTVEIIKKAVEAARKTLPTFPELDKAVANGVKIADLLLLIPAERNRSYTVQTRHGTLRVIATAYTRRAYLMKGACTAWKNNRSV
jgi:hypothetical protein